MGWGGCSMYKGLNNSSIYGIIIYDISLIAMSANHWRAKLWDPKFAVWRTFPDFEQTPRPPQIWLRIATLLRSCFLGKGWERIGKDGKGWERMGKDGKGTSIFSTSSLGNQHLPQGTSIPASPLRHRPCIRVFTVSCGMVARTETAPAKAPASPQAATGSVAGRCWDHPTARWIFGWNHLWNHLWSQCSWSWSHLLGKKHLKYLEMWVRVQVSVVDGVGF